MSAWEPVRVALPAATLLFGFLLSLPFSADFGALTWYARDVCLVSILGAVTAVVLLLGPVRAQPAGRRYDELRMVDTISHQVTGALASLGVVLPAVVLLVVDVVPAGAAPPGAVNGAVATLAGMSPSARDAVAAAGSGRGVIGWKLDPAQRAELLERFPARFAHVVADHVTLAPRAGDGAPLPDETAGRIVGIAVDDDGVEALVVEIDGTTYRPGGSTYHITWSLAEGRRAQESNDVIAARGWQALDEGVPVALRPARLR